MSQLYTAVTTRNIPAAVALIKSGAALSDKYTDTFGTRNISLLCYAIYKNYMPIVWACVDRIKKNPQDLDINAEDSNNWTALHYAASADMADLVTTLLELGAVSSKQNDEGRTALHMAAINHRPETVKAILNYVKFNARDKVMDLLSIQTKGKKTPLQTAIHYGHMDIADILLNAEEGFPNPSASTRSLLARAMQKNKAEVVVKLINRKADLSEKYYFDSNLLIEAIRKAAPENIFSIQDRMNIVQACLKSNKFDINEHNSLGKTALGYAINQKFFNIAAILIDAGADYTQFTVMGRSLLTDSIERKEYDVTLSLLKRGEPLREGRSNLLLRASSNNLVELAELCLKTNNKFNVDEKDNSGNSALYYAVKYGNTSIVKGLIARDALDTKRALHLALSLNQLYIASILIDAGADYSLFLYSKPSLMFKAINGDCPELALSLIKKGVGLSERFSDNSNLLLAALDKNQSAFDKVVDACLDAKKFSINEYNSYGWTALHYAARNGKHVLAERCLKGGANVNMVKQDNWTALHLAVSNNHLKTVEILLRYKPNLYARNKDGNTAIDLAAGSDKIEMATLLINAVAKDPAHASEKRSLFSWAMQYKAIDLIVNWIEQGIGLDEKYENDSNLLMEAIRETFSSTQDFESVVDACLKSQKFNIDAQDSIGHTALHEAARLELTSIANKLLAHNASVAVIRQDDGMTALHQAASTGYVGVELLICSKQCHKKVNGVKVMDIKDRRGMTALEVAVQFLDYPNHRRSAIALINAGADYKGLTYNGRTLLEHARAARYGDLVLALVRREAAISTQFQQFSSVFGTIAQGGQQKQHQKPSLK